MCRKWGEVVQRFQVLSETSTWLFWAQVQRSILLVSNDALFIFQDFFFSRGGHFIWSLLGWKGEMGKQQWNDSWTGKTRLVWPILSKQVTSVDGPWVMGVWWHLVRPNSFSFTNSLWLPNRFGDWWTFFHFCLLHQIGLSPNGPFHGKFEFWGWFTSLDTWAKSGLHHLTSPAACVRIRTSR